MFENEKFYIYTRLINFFLKRKRFESVDYWLNKKKELAKKIRKKYE